MNQKIKNAISYTLVVIASIFAALGIITLAVWYVVLTPSTYTDALEESGVYRNTANTIEAYATRELFDLNTLLTDTLVEFVQESVKDTNYEKFIDNPFVTNFIYQLTDKLTIKLTDSLAKSLQLDKTLEKYGNKLIVSHINWLKSDHEQPIELALVPDVETAKNLDTEETLKLVTAYITISRYDLNKLLKCQNTDEEEKNLMYIANKEYDNLTCVTTNIQNALVTTLTTENKDQSKIVTTIKDYIYAFLEESKVEHAISLLKTTIVAVSYVKSVAYAEKAVVTTTKYAGGILLLLSLITSTIAYFLKKTRSILTWVHTYTIAAVIVIAYALFQLYVTGTIITNVVPKKLLQHIPNTGLPIANLTALFVSLGKFAELVHKTINLYVLRVGGILLGITITIYIVRFVYFKYQLNKKVKKYYEEGKNRVSELTSKKKKPTNKKAKKEIKEKPTKKPTKSKQKEKTV